MTKRECAIVTLYTGITMLKGEDLKYVYDYASELLGRPIYTHEFPIEAGRLKALSKYDFLKLCEEATDD